MTVAELIEELQKMPPYAPVFLSPPNTRYQSGEEVEYVRWQGNHVLVQPTTIADTVFVDEF